MKNTETLYDSSLQVVVWQIEGFVSFEDFKIAGSQTHDLRKKHKANKQLNNIKSMKVLSKDIQDYIDGVYFKEAKESGLKYFAFVVPENTFGRLSMDAVNMEASEKYGMEIEYFDSEKLALSWLSSK